MDDVNFPGARMNVCNLQRTAVCRSIVWEKLVPRRNVVMVRIGIAMARPMIEKTTTMMAMEIVLDMWTVMTAIPVFIPVQPKFAMARITTATD